VEDSVLYDLSDVYEDRIRVVGKGCRPAPPHTWRSAQRIGWRRAAG
jgi:hypothetical protein